MDNITWLLLCLAAFLAGFVDAVVGGGGLIQTPAGLILLPNLPVATVIGTLKIPALSGTASAAFQYLKKVNLDWKPLLLMMLLAMVFAFVGSQVLTMMHNDFMKPVLLIVLTFVAIYTYVKKNFGQYTVNTHSTRKKMAYSVLISCVIGFYDGFIGPGTGSFLVVAFITFMGVDFLHASANAKMVNIATNSGSIILFLIKGSIIWSIAIPMAICNALGGRLGAKLAIKKGNRFIRIFFLIVVIGTLVRFGYDIFVVHH